jgi:hypothetical protein
VCVSKSFISEHQPPIYILQAGAVYTHRAFPWGCAHKCTVHILCLYGDTVHLCAADEPIPPCKIHTGYVRRILQGGGRLSMCTHTAQPTNQSSACYLHCFFDTMVVSERFPLWTHTPSTLAVYPFYTGCLPLSYSGNPGVNGVSHRV